jgi:hypothetical protein
MKEFPDESKMERSIDGTEPIRGGSIGLNRILNTLVEASHTDKRPRFAGVLINAFTIFRNVWGMESFPKIMNLESAFSQDLNLFLDYYDTYLAHVWNHQLHTGKYSPVMVYFPDYGRVPKDIQREHTGQRGEVMDMYNIFRTRHQHETGLVRTLDHTKCYFVAAGHATYPHRDVLAKFRELTHTRTSLYTSGDPVAITTHIPLDLYLMYRLRNLQLLESNTGRIRPASEFHYKLDKDGRVPLQSAVHVVVGDDKMIKPAVSSKIRREVLAKAAEEHWVTRDVGDVNQRLSKITGIPVGKLKAYDFT